MSSHVELVATTDIMSVVTKPNLDHWRIQVLSAELVSKIKDRVLYYAFTDDHNSAKKFVSSLKNVRFKRFWIEPYEWQKVTLLRCTINISKIREMKSDLVMHLDADVFLFRNPWSRMKLNLASEGICIVLQPGFWRPKGFQQVALFSSFPLSAFKDLQFKFKESGQGVWEKNQNSQSYVERKFRKNYFCGGTWFGKNDLIRELLIKLEHQVPCASDNKFVAKSQDERHFNNWVIKTSYTIENPEMCFNVTYPQKKTSGTDNYRCAKD